MIISTTEIMETLAPHRNGIRALSDAVWSHPELAFEEHDALSCQKQYLENAGFSVLTPFAGLDTAYRTEAGTDGGPVFAFAAEYDALPEVGHGCGHNLICACSLAAFRITAELMKKHQIAGRLVLLGTPAEERGCGKGVMLKQNCLDGIDAIMMLHPENKTTTDPGSTGVVSYLVEFRGHTAHAAAEPEMGLNALDAILMVFNAVNAWRQQLPETSRVHGIVTRGGEAPNIIPDYAAARFYLRSPNQTYLNVMQQRFEDIVRGAALMTGTTGRTVEDEPPYQSRKPNAALNRGYYEAAQALGMEPTIPAKSRAGSSDFGNFSQLRPGTHAYFRITERVIASHSREFAAAAHSDFAFAETMKAACALSYTALRYLSDAGFREEAAADFKKA